MSNFMLWGRATDFKTQRYKKSELLKNNIKIKTLDRLKYAAMKREYETTE